MAVDKIRVVITNEQKDIKVPTGLRMLIRRCCNAVLKLEKFEGSAEINVTLVDNEYIRKLNKKHRNKDSATDVLSFPMGKGGKYEINPETGAQMLGDIVISMDKVLEQHGLYGHSLQREMIYLVAHGMLHLIGYDHESSDVEKVRMREKEETVMDLLGLPCTSSYVMSDR